MNNIDTDYLYEAKKLQKDLKKYPEEHWLKRGENMALTLFHEAAVRIPAYKDFLKKNGVEHSKIQTIADFKKLPTTDKDNYLRKYSRDQLCWDGVFNSKAWIISATSGSSGEPFYFPRTELQDDYYALNAELYLRENFKIHEKSTLYIDAFALGIWIGGIFTYQVIRKVSNLGYKLSVVTPGTNKDEVIKCIKNLGSEFDQIIIGCYPPLLKDIIDLGTELKLNWNDYNLGFVFSAEGFSEDFRNYILNNTFTNEKFLSSLNHYGTVDLGTMSHETGLTNLMRKQALKNKKLWFNLFGNINKLPTLTQYIPEMFYFENNNDNLICTSNSGYPLIKYDLKDRGSIINFNALKNIYEESNLNFDKSINSNNLKETIWNLPMVYLYERSDFSVTFSGAQIYPEEIKKALIVNTAEFTTGRFTMKSGYDENAKNYLEINIELMKNVKSDKLLEKTILKFIINTLKDENSEYKILYDSNPKSVIPKIVLWPNNHKRYFSGNGKQLWVDKSR